MVEICPNEYTLKGAVYTVYSDSGCKTSVGKLTVKEDGTANTLTLKEGTYYVKETKSPPGFAKDSKKHTVEVEATETKTMNVKDEPLFDPMTLVLKKKDADNTGLPLEGAQFKVNYYNKVTSSIKGLTPTRSWIFETDSNGRIRLDDKYKVDGDKLFKDEDGEPVGLIGTYEIREIKAPEGYKKMSGYILRTVTEDDTNYIETIYNPPTVNEKAKTDIFSNKCLNL